ncbi:TetR/AcrR family transcriptional regulator [Conexibacter sp. SYSU D00693]|uniref:TetR/AcrR family transcriptional regulator n=1 Tax=Conexibacter sp. SYSU D00693 TaxID=2812560 RepID=UPI00196B47FC|nr:TetR/AcrR family transcriptional regulator [Conexibacter sp. SYSU D00693]
MPSVTRSRSAGRERRDGVERDVLAAVEGLLADGASFTELGVARIADAAGIARSTFYVHFRDKVDLLVRLTEAATEELFADARGWVRGDEGDGLDGLVAAILRIVRQYRRHGALLQALHEVAAYEPTVARFWRARIEDFVAALADQLRVRRDAGETHADLDPDLSARIIAWSVERNVTDQVTHRPAGEDEAFAAALGRLVWRTLYREPA